ncbi:MAG: ribose-5-phosphate isomerase RpiA [Treponema sp.]|jgi:ribose 5-phosphate isomerase A|nr:ribose-5-phosphate isomerase RpiA [Treponema sp.]
MNSDEMKVLAGRTAADALVKSGMKLGLGTGSTAVHVINRVGELLAMGALKDIAVFPTSFQSLMDCEKWKIPVFTLNAPELSGGLDLTIDGADEVDGENRCVKGGGGALLVEKIAAYASSSYALVADERKFVRSLGVSFPVPVEVVPEARLSAARSLAALGGEAVLRAALRKAGPVITEHGNLILDVRFKEGADPVFFEEEINRIPGVVENGFFTKIRPVLYAARRDGTIETRK